MSEISVLIILLSMGLSIVCMGVVLAIASIDECDYRNDLYKQQRREKTNANKKTF
jgi:hypothetical protein|tara:strand:+ start:244 stop:408 length:165 start_codon:yes stop_codon:yes gene_type:complete